MKKNLIYLFILFCLNSLSQNISTRYGTTEGYSGDGGDAKNAKLDGPANLAIDKIGNLYIAELDNHIIRKIDINGTITTIAGTGVAGYSGDGDLAVSAQLNAPYGIDFDSHGNLFISELDNHLIRKIDNSGVITTFSGTGEAGYSGDGGLATLAKMNVPFGIKFDSSDNLFLADRRNSVIRKIDNQGIITTIAGNGQFGYSGDGGLATLAKLNQPRGIAFNSSGELFFTDGSNFLVRKINNDGIITTVAGNNSSGYSGDGGLATLAQLKTTREILFDRDDNFYFSSSGNHTVRKVDKDGIITTIAGNGSSGYSGDGGLAISAQLNAPYGIIFDSKGNLLISERDNNIIRQLENVTLRIEESKKKDFEVKLKSNPVKHIIHLIGAKENQTYKIYNILGLEIQKGIFLREGRINVGKLNRGFYFLKINGKTLIRFLKE